jgi:hypothetical protein
MNVKLSENQINKISKVIEVLLIKNDFDEVCKYRVLPPTFDDNHFKVAIYINTTKLNELNSNYDINMRTDEIVNKSWERIYDFMGYPLSIFLWKVKEC